VNPIENIDEFLELINKPIEKKNFLKREQQIEYTLYIAEDYGFNIDFIEPGLRIINMEHECKAGTIDLFGFR
jgi:RecB family endonuclease NucS